MSGACYLSKCRGWVEVVVTVAGAGQPRVDRRVDRLRSAKRDRARAGCVGFPARRPLREDLNGPSHGFLGRLGRVISIISLLYLL